jgi:hypothetical protein
LKERRLSYQIGEQLNFFEFQSKDFLKDTIEINENLRQVLLYAKKADRQNTAKSQ